MSDATIKIPEQKKQDSLRELLTEDEGFKFGTIKLNRERPRYEIPAPTAEDQDNVSLEKEFQAVVLVVRKNFYQSDEDKEAGKAAKEKRTLYILRAGRVTPERLFVSPTSVQEWKKFVKAATLSDQKYFEVLVTFGAEHVKSQKSGFAWNKIKFTIARSLGEDELAYVGEIRQWVDTCVGSYDDEQDLDKYEEEAVFGGAKKSAPASDDEDPTEGHSKKAAANLEADDEEEDAGKGKGKKAATPPKSLDDEEEETPPATTGKKAAAKPADDDSKKEPSKGREGYPNLEDDEEED